MRKIFENILIPVILLATALAAFSVTSNNLFLFSAYSLEEPHPIGPVWQAVADKSLMIKVANVYTSPVMISTSYSALIDSLFIRAVSFFTGNEPVISDPEFADPVLQWFLIFKHGVFCLALFIGNYFLLRRVLGSATLSGIVHLLFIWSIIAVISPDSAIRIALPVFQASTNSEATFLSFFLFSLFLYYFLNPEKRAGVWTGVLSAYSATVRLQVVPFAFAPLNSVKSWIAFFITAFLLLFGLFTASNEFTSVFRAISMANDGPSKLSFFGHVFENIRLILWIFPYFLPAFLYGIYRLFGPPFTKFKVFYFFCGLVVLLGLLPSHNHQIRYFLGMHSAYLVVAAYGFIEFLRRQTFVEKKETYLRAVGVVLIFCLSVPLVREHSAQALTGWKRVVSYFKNPVNDLFPFEKKFLDLVQKNDKLYVDNRIRVNTEREPFLSVRDKIVFFDLLNDIDLVPLGSKIVTICYPWREKQKFGVSEVTELENESKKYCGDFTHDPFYITRRQNGRLNPLADAAPLVETEVKHIPYFKKLTIEKGQTLTLDADVFATQGEYIQEWEGGIRNPYDRIPHEFQLRNRMYYHSGKVSLRVFLETRYREKASVLEYYFDNVKVGECALATADELRAESKVPEFAFEMYKVWRNKYYPRTCETQFEVKQSGYHDVRVKIKTEEPKGAVRLLRFEYTGI